MSIISYERAYREGAASTGFAYRGLIDALGGGATIVLALCGLASVHPRVMTAIATVVFGVALLLQAGARLSAYVRVAVTPAGKGIPAGRADSRGILLALWGGAAGVALGVLAVLGVGSAALPAAATIAFGAALALSPRVASSLYIETAPGPVGLQAAAGLGAIVLGVVAVAGRTNALTLDLVALLVLGAAIVMTGGGGLSAGAGGLMRRPNTSAPSQQRAGSDARGPADGWNSGANRMEAKPSDYFLPRDAALEHERMGREELLALLCDVTRQRDKVLSQYEAMALQVDEATREIDDALLDARHNAQRAEVGERRAEQEAARAGELSRQLDEERRKSAEIAAELARFRDAIAHAPLEDPWGVLRRAAAQIINDGVAWAQAKIPADSPLLPWFDRTLALAKTGMRLALNAINASLEWTKPRVRDLWLSLKSALARRRSDT